MSPGERVIVLQGWNALVVFFSVLYLTGGFIKAMVVAGFVLVSGLLGFGQRWLLRGGFLVSVFALAVYLGALPPPQEWPDHLKQAREFVVSLQH